MAGVSMKQIKLRIKSMAGTQQLTKAMEMVAASKLRSAQERALRSRPYFERMYDVINQLSGGRMDAPSRYMQEHTDGTVCMIVIAGDRGLAGGYNHNVLHLAHAAIADRDAMILPIGKKAVDYFRARGISVLTEEYREVSNLSVGDCFTISRMLCEKFLVGELSSLNIAYTNFITVLSQQPAVLALLPLKSGASARSPGPDNLVLFEPSSDELFDVIVPEYVGGCLYGAIRESAASEQAARRTAMDSATKNAEEMIDTLSLRYNRARQGAITQEITEIVAGAEA